MAAGLASCGGTADDHSPQAQAIAQVIRGAETGELNLTDPPAVFSGGPPTHEVLTAVVDRVPLKLGPYTSARSAKARCPAQEVRRAGWTSCAVGCFGRNRGRPRVDGAEAVGPMHERRSDQLAVIVVSCSVSYLLRSSATASGFGGPGLARRSASSSK